MHRTGSNKMTALHLHDHFTKHIQCPPLQQVEGEWIANASISAIIFAKKGYMGPGYKYDVKSMYPSIMKSGQLFPVKEGEFKTITDIDLSHQPFFEFGIYRCKVEQCSNNLLKNNKKDYYTHIDLKRAKELNLKIEMIIDGQANFLYYSRDKLLTGNELFGPYVDLLYSIKSKGVTKRSKSILNILWGALCQKLVVRSNVTNDSQTITDLGGPDIRITKIRPSTDGITHIETSKASKPYKHGWARLSPFLLAKGRYNISTIMDKYIETVQRCHTDGILLSKRPEGIIIGESLGDLAYEGHATICHVVHCNLVKGDFFL